MNLDETCSRDLMTTKIVEASGEELLRSAIQRMVQHDVQSLIVPPDRPHHGWGILSGKDCIEVLCHVGEQAFDTLCVEDAMTRPALTLPAGLCARDCIQLMRHSGVRSAPVIDEGRLIGIFSFSDVLRACAGDASGLSGLLP
jgi:CBS domain-containing protein